MTVRGDDFIQSCAVCYREKGYSINLKREGELLQCPQNPAHKFMIVDGVLRQLRDNE